MPEANTDLPAGAQAILAAAGRLFAEKGYDAVSMGEIAAASAVSKGNIYHHFASKVELYTAILHDAVGATRRHLDEATREHQTLHGRLAAFLGAQLQEMTRRELPYRLLLRELSEDGSREGRKIAEGLIRGNFNRLVDFLEAARERGELKSWVDPEAAAAQLISANVVFFQFRSVLGDLVGKGLAENPRQYCDWIVRSILSGIQEKS